MKKLNKIKAVQALEKNVKDALSSLGEGSSTQAIKALVISFNKAEKNPEEADVAEIAIEQITEKLKKDSRFAEVKNEMDVASEADTVVEETEESTSSIARLYRAIPKRIRIPALAICLFIVIFGATSLFSPTSGDQEIRILVEERLDNRMIDPLSLEVNAGELIEFYVSEDEGFFVDGNKEAEALPPYSEKVFVQITMPDGTRLKLSDKITGFEVTSSGKARISVELPERQGNRIWSGSNLEAKRLSEFNKGEITLIVKRPKEIFNENAMIAKEVKEVNLFAGLGVIKKAIGQRPDKEVARVMKPVFNFFSHLFNKEMEAKSH